MSKAAALSDVRVFEGKDLENVLNELERDQSRESQAHPLRLSGSFRIWHRAAPAGP